MQASARVGMTLTALPAVEDGGGERGAEQRLDETGHDRVEPPQLRPGGARRGRVLEARGERGVGHEDVDEACRRARDDRRRVGEAERRDGARQVDHGAALLLGHRAVAAATAGADAELGERLLAHGEQEDLAAVHGQPEAAHALVEDVVGAQRVRAVLAEPLHAAELAVLLVRRGRVLDGAGERGARALEPGEGDRLGGHLVLHVGGADAPDEAVLHDAGERRHAPLAGVGRHDVEVSHHRERAARPLAVQPGHQALPVRELAVELAGDAVRRQVRLHDQRRLGLVAVGRVDPEERGEQLEDFILERLPLVLIQTVPDHGHRPCERGVERRSAPP